MLTIDDGLFLQIPGDSGQRTLHPATVVDVRDNLYSVKLEENVPVEPGQDVLIYYETKREFVQQSANVGATMPFEATPVLRIVTIGEPVSAETRQCYRVSTVTANLSANVGELVGCPLIDVSATGFSIVADDCFKIGQVVPALLVFEGEQFSGKACIQSAKELGTNRIRYGLHCINDRESGWDLERGLSHISTAVQRMQLRRRAG
ncbi:MAG: hypothetical protein JSV91_05590 [Phycisphaerales bacterium]|nr:MAG: hypothetical protein JSV91_05590 [Phycisphaerales bacterium]